MKRIQLLATISALLVSSALAAEKKELVIEYPPPLLTGTAVAVNLPNLEPIDTPAPTILVPEGVTNVALGKEVTSSDDFPIIGELDLITDGDKESEEGYYVELFDGPQWVQIDLEQPMELYAVAVWHFHTQRRAYHDVIVQISNDPEFKEGVVTLFNNDHDNSSGLGKGSNPAYVETNRGKVIPAEGRIARYVRLYSNGNTSNEMNHYCEVEVFGRPS
jgi:hypothetical protein